LTIVPLPSTAYWEGAKVYWLAIANIVKQVEVDVDGANLASILTTITTTSWLCASRNRIKLGVGQFDRALRAIA
jgi:hypothetical protein